MKKVKLKIDVTVPTSWAELSQQDLDYIYSLLALDMPFERVKTFAFLRWTDIRLLECGDAECLLAWKGHTFKITITRLSAATKALDWLRTPPGSPTPLAEIRGQRGIAPTFAGVPFSTYLMIDNYWQGYLGNPTNAEPLDEIARVLYPGLEGKIARRVQVNCFYWIAALKTLLARYFPHFLSETPSGGEPQADSLDQRRRMDAQIRALTKGDITREEQVLASDTWRALAELDALAREAEEFNKKTK